MKKKRITFEEYYQEIFGERWKFLKEAFAKDPCYFELKEGLNKSYFLDEASYLCARTLDVQSGDHVLDMCAAPGGKTLVLALGLNGEGFLVANDRSRDRRNRLERVINDHLPKDLRENIRISCTDAARWGLAEQNQYDKILLDAPCSSERHVFLSPKHLSQWTPGRTKSLAHQQYALAVAGLTALKPGGKMIYSTCALSPMENDEVLRKLFKKKKQAEHWRVELPMGEKTEFGWAIWPDNSEGRGPIYLAGITKSEQAT